MKGGKYLTDSVFSQPIEIDRKTWVVGAQFRQSIVPQSLYMQNRLVSSRLAGYSRIRFKLHVRIQVNAPPTMYGMIRSAFFRQTEDEVPTEVTGWRTRTASCANLYTARNSLRLIFAGCTEKDHADVFVGNSSTAELEVDWEYPEDSILFRLSSPSTYLRPYGCLNMVSDDTLYTIDPNDVNRNCVVTTYAWMSDVVVSGEQRDFIIPQSARDSTMLVQDSKVTDVEPSDNHDWSISEIAKIPGYIGGGNWTTSNATNTNIFTAFVKPLIGVADVGVGAAAGEYSQCKYIPAGYLSIMSRLWRGTACFRVIVPVTKFHSGSLRLSHMVFPALGSYMNNPAVQPALSSIVMDLRDTTSVVFKIPFGSQSKFKEVAFTGLPAPGVNGTIGSAFNGGTIPDSYSEAVQNGVFVVEVLDPLRCPSDAVNTLVNVNVEAWFEDFELAGVNAVKPYGISFSDIYAVQSAQDTDDVSTIIANDGDSPPPGPILYQSFPDVPVAAMPLPEEEKFEAADDFQPLDTVSLVTSLYDMTKRLAFYRYIGTPKNAVTPADDVPARIDMVLPPYPPYRGPAPTFEWNYMWPKTASVVWVYGQHTPLQWLTAMFVGYSGKTRMAIHPLFGAKRSMSTITAGVVTGNKPVTTMYNYSTNVFTVETMAVDSAQPDYFQKMVSGINPVMVAQLHPGTSVHYHPTSPESVLAVNQVSAYYPLTMPVWTNMHKISAYYRGTGKLVDTLHSWYVSSGDGFRLHCFQGVPILYRMNNQLDPTPSDTVT